MKTPTSPQKPQLATFAHRFTTYGQNVAELADKLCSEFALLQSAAIDLNQAASVDTADLYNASALNALLASEFQRLNAPWTHRHPLGNHQIEPMARKVAAIADFVTRKAAA